jgi:hypothetical protein
MLSPLRLAIGVDQSSPEYLKLVGSFYQPYGNFQCIHDIEPEPEPGKDYSAIDRDARDNRVLLWCRPEDPGLKIHLFANSVAVLDITLPVDEGLTAEQLAKKCQQQTRQRCKEVYAEFYDDLKRLAALPDSRQLCFEPQQEEKPEQEKKPELYWISRTLLIDKDKDSFSPEHEALLKDWLKDTQRPEDADDIIKGRIDYSLTWLNYAVVDQLGEEDYRLSTMILAQYFYAAQAECNKQLRQAIDSAYHDEKLSVSERKLSHSRVATRLHQVDYREHQKFLNRQKRQLLDEIMTDWDFQQLTSNSQLMIEICSSRLEEADNKKRERSTVMTDLLLVTLSFFAVFELSLYLTQFSREMMSRPALDYNDDRRSFFLEFIAGVDADFMFALGFGLTVALVLAYRKIKVR